jgi:hypothetical protein
MACQAYPLVGCENFAAVGPYLLTLARKRPQDRCLLAGESGRTVTVVVEMIVTGLLQALINS